MSTSVVPAITTPLTIKWWRAGTLLAALGLVYTLLHASLMTLTGGRPFAITVARTSVNAALWFAVIPCAVLAYRAVTTRWPTIARLSVGALATLLLAAGCGVVQGIVAMRLRLGRMAPPLSGAFFFLDLNLAVIALAAAVAYMLSRHQALVLRDRQLLELDMRLSDVRSRFLAYQLQPHFLFNALSLVATLTPDAPRDAARILRHLGTLLRAAVESARLSSVPLREDLIVLDAYRDIIASRHAESLRIETDVAPESLDAQIPPLLLQPLLENAIRHALVSPDGVGRVSLSTAVRDGRLLVRIENSVDPHSREPSGLGIGLRNTRERLTRFYQGDFSLDLDVGRHCAMLHLDVPLHPSDHRRTDDAARDAATASDPPLIEPSSDATFPRLHRRRLWIIAVGTTGFWGAMWLFWCYQMFFFRVSMGDHRVPAIEGGRNDLISAVIWTFLTPLALAAAHFVPIRRRRWAGPLLVHATLAIGFALAEVRIIMVFSHDLPDRVFAPTNLNPIILDVLIYALILCAIHARAVSRWFNERRTATQRMEARLARAQFDAAAVEVQPRLISAALCRVATTVVRDPGEGERSVLSLAESLRQILRSTERSAVPVDEALLLLRALLHLRCLAFGTPPVPVALSNEEGTVVSVAPSELVAESHDLIVDAFTTSIVVEVVDRDSRPGITCTAFPSGHTIYVQDAALIEREPTAAETSRGSG